MASSVDTDHRYGSNLGCMKANEGCFSSIMIIKTPFVCPGILSEDKKVSISKCICSCTYLRYASHIAVLKVFFYLLLFISS